MDYDNGHLNYPNLVSAHIKTTSATTTQLPPPPPPATSLVSRIERSEAVQSPPLEPYKFEVEKEVLKRRAGKEKKGGVDVSVTPSPSQEPIELDLSGGVVGT